LIRKFRDLERLRRKSEVQYETLTGASRRLLELVCTSEVVRLRARPGPTLTEEARKLARSILRPPPFASAFAPQYPWTHTRQCRLTHAAAA